MQHKGVTKDPDLHFYIEIMSLMCGLSDEVLTFLDGNLSVEKNKGTEGFVKLHSYLIEDTHFIFYYKIVLQLIFLRGKCSGFIIDNKVYSLLYFLFQLCAVAYISDERSSYPYGNFRKRQNRC